jgi:sugar lactone lactonase YvrE
MKKPQEIPMQRTRAGLVLIACLFLLIPSVLYPVGETPKEKDKVRALVAAFYPEGPCYLGDRLYYVEYSGHRVMIWDGVNTRQFWRQDGSGPSAVLPLKNGDLLVASYDTNTLVRLDSKGKTLETIKADSDGKPFKGPNDFVTDSHGGVYFSASGKWKKGSKAKGKVYYWTPDGKVKLVAQDIHYANGLAIIDSGKTLLVAEHLRNRVLKYTIGKEGGLSRGAIWKRLADIQPDPNDADWYTGPDGLKTDLQGNVYICQFGASRILVTGSDGKWLRTIAVPLKYVTNLAFGPREATLFVTAVQDPWQQPYLGAVYAIPNR